MINIWLSRYTKLLAAATFLLILAGGLVTSTQSGLSVPDWPLSYGKLMPKMVGGIRFEHTHRMVATLVGLMTLVLTFWIGLTEKRRWLRWSGIAVFGMVVLQGILGGLTVLYLLPAPISIFHACLAQTFFAFVVGMAYFTSREWASAKVLPPIDFLFLRKTLWLLLILIYLQLILGATLRHTANHFVLISHIGSAFLVVFHAGLILRFVFDHASGEKRLVTPSVLFGVLTLLQLGLGMGAFIYTIILEKAGVEPGFTKVAFVTLHQTLGVLLLATVFFLILRVYRLSDSWKESF